MLDLFSFWDLLTKKTHSLPISFTERKIQSDIVPAVQTHLGRQLTRTGFIGPQAVASIQHGLIRVSGPGSR